MKSIFMYTLFKQTLIVTNKEVVKVLEIKLAELKQADKQGYATFQELRTASKKQAALITVILMLDSDDTRENRLRRYLDLRGQ